MILQCELSLDDKYNKILIKPSTPEKGCVFAVANPCPWGRSTCLNPSLFTNKKTLCQFKSMNTSMGVVETSMGVGCYVRISSHQSGTHNFKH